MLQRPKRLRVLHSSRCDSKRLQAVHGAAGMLHWLHAAKALQMQQQRKNTEAAVAQTSQRQLACYYASLMIQACEPR